MPYVLVDRMVPGLNAHFVGVDDAKVGALATGHLIERGYRRIAHIRGPDLSTGRGRFQGYDRALKRHGCERSKDLVVVASSTNERGEQCGYLAMQTALQSPTP